MFLLSLLFVSYYFLYKKYFLFVFQCFSNCYEVETYNVLKRTISIFNIKTFFKCEFFKHFKGEYRYFLPNQIFKKQVKINCKYGIMKNIDLDSIKSLKLG